MVNHYGPVGNNSYHTVIRTGIWGYNGGGILFDEYFSSYGFNTNWGFDQTAHGSIGGDSDHIVSTWDEGGNNWYMNTRNNGNYDGMNMTVWLKGVAQKAGTVVYTMPSDYKIAEFRQYVGGWTPWSVANTFNSYPTSAAPTITINVLDPDGLQNKIDEIKRRKSNVKGVVNVELVNTYNETLRLAEDLVTKARDYTQNFDIDQIQLEDLANRLTTAIENIENSQKFGVVDGGQYCVSTELRISKSAYDSVGSDAVIAYLDGSSQISKNLFVWVADS